MAGSINVYNKDVMEHIRVINPNTVLDIGPGSGKYRDILQTVSPNAQCDAVEATERYIEKFNLNQRYRKVYNKDIVDFIKQNSIDNYDLCILGDVLEHLFLSQVIDVLDTLAYKCKFLMLMWPSNYPQDTDVDSNYQLHKSNFFLTDLNRFNIQIYKKTFIQYYNRLPIEVHYALIAGHFVPHDQSLRTIGIDSNGYFSEVIHDV